MLQMLSVSSNQGLSLDFDSLSDGIHDIPHIVIGHIRAGRQTHVPFEQALARTRSEIPESVGHDFYLT